MNAARPAPDPVPTSRFVSSFPRKAPTPRTRNVGTETVTDLPRLVLLAFVAVAIGTGAALFGFVDQNSHPSFALWSAFVVAIAGSGIVLLAHTTVWVRRNSEGNPDPLPRTVEKALIPLVAMLSMGAAVVHFAVIKEHFEEFWAYGTFFLIVAIPQLAWAIWVALRPLRLLYVLGAIGNAIVVGVFVLTRTIGPIIGPEADEVAPVGFGDTVTTLFEVLIVALCVALLIHRLMARPLRPSVTEALITFNATVVTPLVALALFSTLGGRPFVPPAG